MASQRRLAGLTRTAYRHYRELLHHTLQMPAHVSLYVPLLLHKQYISTLCVNFQVELENLHTFALFTEYQVFTTHITNPAAQARTDS